MAGEEGMCPIAGPNANELCPAFCDAQKSWFETSADLGWASLPVMGVAAGAALIGGASLLGLGKIYNQFKQDGLNALPNLVYQRQRQSNEASELNQGILTAGFAVTLFAVIATATQAFTLMAGAGVVSGVAVATLAAIALNNIVHNYLAQHDGRNNPNPMKKLFS